MIGLVLASMGTDLPEIINSIGIGSSIVPIVVTGGLALITGLYAIFVPIVIISLLALREKVGALFIVLYLFSFVTLSAI